MTAIAPTSSETFLTGTMDGRVYAYYPSTLESKVLEGVSHSNNVSGLATSSKDGTVYSIGYDDHVREISPDGASFLYAPFYLSPTNFS